MSDVVFFLNTIFLVTLFTLISSNQGLLATLLLAELLWSIVYTLTTILIIEIESFILISLPFICLVLAGLEAALGLILFILI